MNQIERIVQQEKGRPYKQRNRDLFTYYVLSLINQEQSKQKTRRISILVGLASIVPVLIFLPNLESIYFGLVGSVLHIVIPVLYNLTYASITVSLSIFFLLLLFQWKGAPPSRPMKSKRL